MRFLGQEKIGRNIALGLVGALLTTTLAVSAYRYEQENKQLMIENGLNDRARSIGNVLATNIQLLEFLSIYYDSTDGIANDKFLKLAQEMKAQRPEIKSIAWAPFAPSEERTQAQANFRRLAQDVEKYAGVAGGDTKSERLTTSYLSDIASPTGHSIQETDFHLSHLPALENEIEQAASTGEITLSDVFGWSNEQQNSLGVMLFSPIYGDKISAEENLHSALRGFIVMALDVPTLIRSISAVSRNADIDFFVEAHTVKGDVIRVFDGTSERNSDFTAPVSIGGSLAPNWTITASREQSLGSNSSYNISFFIVLAGIVCTFLLVRLNRAAYFREQRIRSLVDIRTEELTESKNRLQEESLADPLTGLSNRRCLDKVLAVEWAKAIRNDTKIALMLIDIDHFKRYNDHYGHLQGDKAIISVANVLLASFRRQGDTVARFGGEEFIIVLPLRDDAPIYAARLVRAVANMNIPHAESPVAKNLTISVGLFEGKPSDGVSIDSALQAADSALYKAKHAGRNRAIAA